MWIYIAQNVRDRGLLESDCKKHCPEYENLEDGYLETPKPKERETPLIRTSEKGKTEGELLIRDLLSQHNDELQSILKGIPQRLLAYFVKEVFPSNDGLCMYEEDWSWGRDDYNFLHADTETEEHLCLLKDIRIKSKRDELLERLVELSLAVREVHSYAYGGMPYGKDRRRGLVYVIAPQVMNFLNDYISQNFKGETFDKSLEKFHILFHIFDFPAKFWPNDLFTGQGLSYELQERLKLKGHYQLFEESCQSLVKSGAIELSNNGKYYVADEKRFNAEIHERFLNPLVEYLLEGKLPEPVGEPIKPEFPRPEPIQPDVYFRNNTWKVFYDFLASAESSIDICADTVEADALLFLLKGLKNKNVLANTKIMACSIKGVKKIIEFGIPKDNLTQCSKLHAKFLVKDNNALLISSSNITLGALGGIGGRDGSYEASVIIEKDQISIKKAQSLFEGIWSGREEIKELKAESSFISSYYGIPSRVKELIEKAKREIVIAVPPLFEDESFIKGNKSIIEYIKELNPSVTLTIYTNNSIPKNSWKNFSNLREMRINLKLVSQLLHAKVYLFDEEIALISSLNLSYASWAEAVEVGYLTKDQKHIAGIKEVLDKELNIVDIAKRKSYEEKPIRKPEIPDLRRINFKFETEGKKQNLIEKLKRTPMPPIKPPPPNNIVKSSITLNLIGNPIGIRDGGVLEIGIKKIKVKHQREQAIQKELSVDISGLKIGDSLYVKNLDLPGYISVLTPPHTIIATVKEQKPIPPLPKPQAKVKTQKGWRIGRGFSYPELSKAGFAIRKAKERSIPIDKRRKTTHIDNIKQLIKKGSDGGN